MKQMLGFLAMIWVAVVMFSASTRAGDDLLTISHVLGTHSLGGKAKVEIYANTKGELRYSFLLNGSPQGGAALAKNAGENTTFYWDDAALKLWVVTPDSLSSTDVSDPKNISSQLSSRGDGLESAKLPNAVREVMAVSGGDSSVKGALTISQILGKHPLTERVQIEVYADTRNEIWYSPIIDGKPRGGSTVAKNTGENTVFYWDDGASILWVITPEQVGSSDFSDPKRTSTKSHDITDAASLTLPKPVLEAVEKMTAKSE